MKLFKWIYAFLMMMLFIVQPTGAGAAQFKIELNERWAYYPNELIQQGSVATGTFETVNLPIEFADLHGGEISGYGTFVKVVEVPQEAIGQMLGLELPFTYSAAKVFINGELYEEVGRVADQAAAHERDLKSVVIPIKMDEQALEIAIQISSFDHIRGGFSAAPVLGDWDTIHKGFMWERYVALFVMTIIFIVGLMTLLIGLLERREKMFLVFGLFSLVVAIRGFVAVPFLYHELPYELSYEWATRLEYITTNLCFSLYAIFIYLIYNKLFSKWILYPGLLILWTLAAMALFADVVTFQQAFFNVFPAMAVFIVYNLWIMVRAFVLKLQLAKSLLIGVLFVFIGLIVDFLAGMGLIYSPPLANFMIAMNVLIVLSSLCYNYVKHMRIVSTLNEQLDEEVKVRTKELDSANRELKKLVAMDGLTGIYNRHKFNEAIEAEFKEAIDTGQPLSLIMLDVDEFKKYNDYYGHVKGDELLIQMARLMQEKLPEEALLARYGGEEFAVILPNVTIQQATQIAEGLRATIELARIPHLGRDVRYVTISLGCAERVTDHISDEKHLVQVADERLYKSKANGRNQLTTA